MGIVNDISLFDRTICNHDDAVKMSVRTVIKSTDPNEANEADAECCIKV